MRMIDIFMRVILCVLIACILTVVWYTRKTIQ